MYLKKIIFSQKQLKVAIDQVYSIKSRRDAIWKSLLFPGYGLVDQDQDRGYAYLGGATVTLLGAVASSIAGYVAVSDYNDSSPQTAHRRDDANAHYDRVNLLWVTTAALWAASFVDSYHTAKNKVVTHYGALSLRNVAGAR